MAVSVSHVADNAREARSLTNEAGRASREGTGETARQLSALSGELQTSVARFKV